MKVDVRWIPVAVLIACLLLVHFHSHFRRERALIMGPPAARDAVKIEVHLQIERATLRFAVSQDEDAAECERAVDRYLQQQKLKVVSRCEIRRPHGGRIFILRVEWEAKEKDEKTKEEVPVEATSEQIVIEARSERSGPLPHTWKGHLRCPSHEPTLPSKVSLSRGAHETRVFATDY